MRLMIAVPLASVTPVSSTNSWLSVNFTLAFGTSEDVVPLIALTVKLYTFSIRMLIKLALSLMVWLELVDM